MSQPPLAPGFTFTIPYFEEAVTHTGSLRRPYLHVQIAGSNGQFQTTRGLVDTGADTTSLPLAMAPLLGYSGAQLVQRQARQAGGALNTYLAQVPAICQVASQPVTAYEFVPTFIQDATQVLLGRLDFMRAWMPTFDEHTQLLTLVWTGRAGARGAKPWPP